MSERRLILMRHAKSSWDDASLSDHARPLNRRGQRDGPAMGQALVDAGWTPDHILSSNACRTRQTVACMSTALGEVPTTFTRSLYGADLDEVGVQIGAVDDGVRTLLVMGHNPTCEEAVWWCARTSVRMTTANAALLLTEALSWADAWAGRCWSLTRHIVPRDLS